MNQSPLPTDVEALLAAAQVTPSPVYLLIGEPFQTEAAARRLIDVLVPVERRSFNLETYDGRVAPIGPILGSLRMRGLFPGTKVIWVREPTLFLSGEGRSEVSEALFAAWHEGRHADAAEKLLTLAALAGWGQDRFAEVDWSRLPPAALIELAGRSLDDAERAALERLRAFCAERDLTVSDFRDESALLHEFLAAGMPAGAVLLCTATTVDRRKRVVKAVREVGTVAEFTLPRERSGALSAAGVEQLIAQVVAPRGKRLDPPAHRLVLERAGRDAALLAMELEKLCLYVGDAAEIGADDVRACVRDLGESWVFDFTRALAQRQAGAAVTLLRALFDQGEHPLRLLALIARELRLLLLARDCLTDTLAGRWSPRIQFSAFRDRLLPLLSEPQREAFGGLHPYVLYLCLQNASRTSSAALRRAVLALQALDIRLKSSPSDPRLLLEAFVLDVCGAGKPERPGSGGPGAGEQDRVRRRPS